MHRGCVSTLAASPKIARERSAGSEIAANADGDCNVLEGWAEPQVDPTTQNSNVNVMAGPARISPHPSHHARPFLGRRRGQPAEASVLSRPAGLVCALVPLEMISTSNFVATGDGTWAGSLALVGHA